ncbi:MmcQ/YjbR family DNA-binding protein [Rhizobium sp. RAF56]|uniref:MmcQ/YjbR family DNA-binding protein n=1 Tax=Rhizobium sp. RAF56 TaxID=3233062 RepID=UPI003F997C7D
MDDASSDRLFTRIRTLAEVADLPEVELGTSYGRPALKVGGKGFAIVKDDETIVIAVAIADKELLIEMAPDIYYQTDHYVGWPSLPLRAAAIGDEELKQRLIDAWRFRAPSKQRAIFDQRPR